MTSTVTAPAHALADLLGDVDTVRHGFFGRQGGVSAGLYESLNTGPGSGDDPEAVAENRARAAAALGVEPTRLLTGHQVHSADVAVVDAPFGGDERPKVDGLVTRTPGLALGALAADCAPVLFVDPKAMVIGAAHAGWRGALGGVTDAVVRAMVRLGAGPERILAAIGPSISKAAYEVGPEFVERFTDADPATADLFASGQGDRSHFDLKGYVARRLAAAGVGSVEILPDCTLSEPARYFSHRRGVKQGDDDYGRNLSAIAICA